MPIVWIPSSSLGTDQSGNVPPSVGFAGLPKSGPDPRSRRGRGGKSGAQINAELRQQHIEKQKQLEEIRKMAEERKQREKESAEQKKAEQAARRHERAMKDPVVAKMYADREATKKMFADRKAAIDAFNKLSPEEKKAELARNRAENKAAMARASASAQGKQAMQTLGYQPEIAADMNAPAPARPATPAPTQPTPSPYSQRMAQASDPVPSTQFAARPTDFSSISPEVAQAIQSVANTVLAQKPMEKARKPKSGIDSRVFDMPASAPEPMRFSPEMQKSRMTQERRFAMDPSYNPAVKSMPSRLVDEFYSTLGGLLTQGPAFFNVPEWESREGQRAIDEFQRSRAREAELQRMLSMPIPAPQRDMASGGSIGAPAGFVPSSLAPQAPNFAPWLYSR